ncbi:MAG: ZIP family metal transporter [Planctomycetota bacterium]
MNHAPLLTAYGLAIVAASVLGGLVPILVRLTHGRLQLAVSLTAGFMLGVAVLHMLPHALADLTPATAMLWTLGGLLTMFFIERFFRFHHHDVAERDGDDASTTGHSLSWGAAAVGMTLHSLLAGVALGSAVAAADSAHIAPAGFGVFLVIVLHKPLDALTVITLTAAAGMSRPRRHLTNALFALAVPLGMTLFLLGLSRSGLAAPGELVGVALAFSAGTFLCIALSDLLPELHFHAHDRGKLSAALLLGVALAFAVARAEHATHDHAHGGHQQEHYDVHDHHDHAGHDH